MTIDSILPVPEVLSAERVLCIQPHYDDNDIGAGGTLLRLAQQGAEIHYLTVTDDLMGVIDVSLTPQAAAECLKRDQLAAARIVGVKQQYWLGYPDAGQYDRYAVRRDLLAAIRRIRPDFIFAPDPWLTYEAHPDHIAAGLAAAEAVIFSSLKRIASSDRAVDAAYEPHRMAGVAFYFTREPNEVVDVSSVWETKLAAVRCYEAQFNAEGMDELVMALEFKSRQVAAGRAFEHGEPLKVLHPSALHCGI